MQSGPNSTGLLQADDQLERKGLSSFNHPIILFNHPIILFALILLVISVIAMHVSAAAHVLDNPELSSVGVEYDYSNLPYDNGSNDFYSMGHFICSTAHGETLKPVPAQYAVAYPKGYLPGTNPPPPGVHLIVIHLPIAYVKSAVVPCRQDARMAYILINRHLTSGPLGLFGIYHTNVRTEHARYDSDDYFSFNDLESVGNTLYSRDRMAANLADLERQAGGSKHGPNMQRGVFIDPDVMSKLP